MTRKRKPEVDVTTYVVGPRLPQDAPPGDYAVSVCVSCGHRIRHSKSADIDAPKLCYSCAGGVAQPN